MKDVLFIPENGQGLTIKKSSMERILTNYEEFRDSEEKAKPEKAKAKGKKLEDFTDSLFQLIPDLSLLGQDEKFPWGEIDLIYLNENERLRKKNVGSHFIVECKNQQNKAEISDIHVFKGKMKDTNVNFGIFHSYNGFTNDAKQYAWNTFFRDNQIIILITKEDIERLKHDENVLLMLIDKINKVLMPNRC